MRGPLLGCLFGVVLLMVSRTVSAEDVLEGDRLSIAAVDTEQQVARYQNVVFRHVAGAEWQLLSYDEVGEGVHLAPISQLSSQVTDAFPAHVLLQVAGVFPSGCDYLGRVSQRRDGNHFSVAINQGTRTDPSVACTMAVVPFTTTLSLPVYGLPAGEYSYSVNGATGTFELAQDNVLPGDCPNVSQGWCEADSTVGGPAVDWTTVATPEDSEGG
ncbi:hypothetical protein [Endothiovibrio diazotrophicus]